MKTLLTLTTLAALLHCLHAEEINLNDAFTRIEALSGAQTVATEEENDGGIPYKNTETKLVGRSPDYAHIKGEDIDKILNKTLNTLTIDTAQPGWKALSKDDFTKVNSADDTWEWKADMLSCTGKPVSVMRTVKEYKNFEMVVEWRHNKPAGNSGVFVWATPDSIEKLTEDGKPGLPKGIEVQVLDNGYTDKVAAKGGKTNWFTTHGDVFPVGVQMTPIGKTSPDGSRSFPRKDLSKDHGNWNHYYIRAINSEVRLWVNGQEVSGGTNCDPAQGYLCLESEGSPIDFRNLYIRELP